jgi:importin subunit alpha-2
MKRTEVNVELRKSKKEDNLQKRRNLESEPLSPLQKRNHVAAANMNIKDIVNGMFVAAFVFSISYFLIFFYIT